MKTIALMLFGLIMSVNYFAVNRSHAANTGVIIIDGQVVSGHSSSGMTQSDSKQVSRTRKLSPFKRIRSDIVADISIVAAKRYVITIKAAENIIDKISTDIVNNELLIDSKENFFTKKPISLLIEVPLVKAINQSGVGSIDFNNVTQDELMLIIDGQGDISGRGKVSTLDAKIDGVGNLKLKNLQTNNAHVEISGTGNAELHVNNILVVIIDGVGDVIYTGQPKKINKIINGIGTVRH